MSRSLPTRPNLEHLKKQAKDLLRELQQRNPGARLADAQRVIALEYGFRSWPKLRAHVDSLLQMMAPGAAPVPQHPIVGTWTANLSKSKRHPANQFRHATLQFALVGDTLTITDVVVNASGREERGTNTIETDGKEHSSEHANGYVLVATWLDSQVLEAVARKDGELAGWGRYEVSTDGARLTISADEQVIVCDRT